MLCAVVMTTTRRGPTGNQGVSSPHPLRRSVYHEIRGNVENPPVYGESRCELCDGTGIYHEPDGTLNSLRLTREEQEIQLRYELYYDRLENSYEDEEFV